MLEARATDRASRFAASASRRDRRLRPAASTGCSWRPRQRSSATGSGSSPGSRASTCPATTNHFVVAAGRSPRRSASVGLVIAALVPDRSRAAVLEARLRRDARADDRRVRRRRDDPRLEALDRPRRHPVPAVRAREGALRPRARGLRRRARRARSRAGGRSSRRSGSARSRSCSSSSSPTSGRRSSTRRRSSPCSSSSGVRWRQLAVAARWSACSRSLSVLWLLPALGIQVLKPYQAARLTLSIPSADPSGITYNLNQSITAVGSGGLTGRGVVEASQTRLDYLPEHATDFAFASLAEQRGFVGSRDPAAPLPARRLARAPRGHRAPATSTARSSQAGSSSRSSSRSS